MTSFFSRIAFRVFYVVVAASLTLAVPAGAEPGAKLTAFPADPSQVSVAGISSGAFMANQLHIAHSADVIGAAMIAGGLYGCAVEDVQAEGVQALASKAFYDCMSVPFLLDDVPTLKKRMSELASKHWIDPTSNIARSRIYLFTGGSDVVVASETVEEAKALYAALGVPADHIRFVDHTGPAGLAGHSWVTIGYGSACALSQPPYIDKCGYDQAGEELKAIYGQDLASPPRAAAGRIVAFDQTEFVAKGEAKPNGLSDVGYLYVPPSCEPGAAPPCRLHVVLHGCLQSAEALGDTFYTKIGVNEWADANRILVLYPQAHALTADDLRQTFGASADLYANPNGCWNWWGYADDRQYLTKKGVQIGAIWAMVERIEGR